MRRVILLLSALLLSACGDRPSPRTDSGDTAARGAPAAPARRPARVSAVQLGAFADSANAARLRDSLATAGWDALLMPATQASDARWRVAVAASSGGQLARFTVHALRLGGRDAVIVQGEARPAQTVDLLRVNTGSPGMLRTVRWAQPADRSALLVVEDPAAVENEPVPNGFVFASERGPFLVQRDSAWDVAPAADWRRLAYGRAYVVVSRDAAGVSAAQWRDLGERMGLPADSVRRAAFASSSMNIAYAIGQPVVIDASETVEAGSGDARSAERVLPFAGGWRVRWSADGRVLGVGTGPRERATDDAPPARWLAADPERGVVTGSLQTNVSMSAIRWEDGPLLDISVPFEIGARRSVAIRNGMVQSRDGWIRLTRDVGGSASPRIVGPGAVLAATAEGRFVAALAMDPDARENDSPLRLVVYHITD